MGLVVLRTRLQRGTNHMTDASKPKRTRKAAVYVLQQQDAYPGDQWTDQPLPEGDSTVGNDPVFLLKCLRAAKREGHFRICRVLRDFTSKTEQVEKFTIE